jgi:hypothetical protein
MFFGAMLREAVYLTTQNIGAIWRCFLLCISSVWLYGASFVEPCSCAAVIEIAYLSLVCNSAVLCWLLAAANAANTPSMSNCWEYVPTWTAKL